jgi:hypothetical protein
LLEVKCLVVVIAGFLAIGCTDNSPTGPSSNAFPISGRVIDYRTQASVAGAVVRFRGEMGTSGEREAVSDARGQYSVMIPAFDRYHITVNGTNLGLTPISTTEYRGDLYVNTSGCRARYGVVVDATTNEPLEGATVRVPEAPATVTGADGWYFVDGGCPGVVLPGGTTVMTVSHPRFEHGSAVVGRGFAGFLRQDFTLQRTRSN